MKLFTVLSALTVVAAQRYGLSSMGSFGSFGSFGSSFGSSFGTSTSSYTPSYSYNSFGRYTPSYSQYSYSYSTPSTQVQYVAPTPKPAPAPVSYTPVTTTNSFFSVTTPAPAPAPAPVPITNVIYQRPAQVATVAKTPAPAPAPVYKPASLPIANVKPNPVNIYGDGEESGKVIKVKATHKNGYPLDFSEKTKGRKKKHFCNQTNIRKYNIEITAANIRTLNDDISAEEYVPCSITTDYLDEVEQHTFTGVGCRYKGAVGSLLACLDAKTGRPNGKCRKFSLKVDGNYFRDDNQEIDGMKRAQFHGLAVDKSLVSERLAYNMMETLGIAASCAMHAEVYVNGAFDGVYAYVEDVNIELTKRKFKEDFNEGKGGLYKDFWFRPEQTTEAWLNKHQTSGKDEAEFMMEVSNAIRTVSSEFDCGMMDKYFDLDIFAQVTAFNDFMGHTDDWRVRHNFYWYVREDDEGKKLVMIPWDYDRLHDEGGGLDFRRNKIGTWWQSTGFNYNSQECTNPPADSSVQGLAYARGVEKKILERKVAALPPDAASKTNCDKVTRMLSNCAYDTVKSYFEQYKIMYPTSTINALIDGYVAQISGVVAKDSSVTNSGWRTGVNGLKTYLKNAPGLAPAKGKTPSSNTQQQGYGNQFGGGRFGGFRGL